MGISLEDNIVSVLVSCENAARLSDGLSRTINQVFVCLVSRMYIGQY